MKVFKAKLRSSKKISSKRKIHFKVTYENYEKITKLSEKTGSSIETIVMQCINYALNNLE